MQFGMEEGMMGEERRWTSFATYLYEASHAGPHAVIRQLLPPALVHHRSLVRDAADEVHRRCDEGSVHGISSRYPKQQKGHEAHMMPNTPAGPTACCSSLTPPHAAAERDSKK